MLEKYFKTVERSYGRVFRIWSTIFPYFVIAHPDDVHTVLSSWKHTEKVYSYKLLHNFLGNGLITSAGKYTIIYNSLNFSQISNYRPFNFHLISWRVGCTSTIDSTAIPFECFGAISWHIY